MEQDYYEEDSLPYLQWDNNLYDAVDSSIYTAVNELMTPMEQRLAAKIEQVCARMAQPLPGTSVPLPPVKAPDQDARDGLPSSQKEARHGGGQGRICAPQVGLLRPDLTC